MKKISLIKYFTLYSLIAFALTGAVLVFFISNHIRNEKISGTKNLALLTLDAIIKPEFQQNDFLDVIPDSKMSILDEKISLIMKSTNITGINIINKDKKIIYSYKPDLIGKFSDEKTSLEKVFSNKIVYNITQSNDTKSLVYSAKNTDLIRIYAPMNINNTVVGAYEVFIPYSEINIHVIQLNKIIFLTVFSGLLVLYLLLIKIIQNASRTLVTQNLDLLDKTNELETSYRILNTSYKNTIIALSKAVDARDAYTAGHSERVAYISLEIGQALKFTKEQLDRLETAALFHDIGKIGIPDHILNKAGKLSDEEYEVIKQHPQMGVNILRTIDFLEDALPIILHHHERFSGNGYPTKIAGEQIPLESRIIAVADTYDAMTSDRPYRKGTSHKFAVEELVRFKNDQFDARVVDAFLHIEKRLSILI